MRTTPRFARFPARFLPNRSSSKSSARRSLTQTRGGHLARSRRMESYAKSEACESTPARIRTMRRTKDTIESSRRHDCSSDAPQSRSNLRMHFRAQGGPYVENRARTRVAACDCDRIRVDGKRRGKARAVIEFGDRAFRHRQGFDAA